MTEFLSEPFDMRVNGTQERDSRFVRERDFVRKTGSISAVLGLINLFWIPFSLVLPFVSTFILINAGVFSQEYSLFEITFLIGTLFQLTAVFSAILGLTVLNNRRNSAAFTDSSKDSIVIVSLAASIFLVVLMILLSVLADVSFSGSVLLSLIIVALAIVRPGLVTIRIRPLTRFNFLPLVSAPLLFLLAVAPKSYLGFGRLLLSNTVLWLILAGQLFLDAGAVYLPSKPYKGLSIRQIWQQYDVGKIILNAFLGAIILGIGGGLGSYHGLLSDLPIMDSFEFNFYVAFYISPFVTASVVLSGSLGFIFGLIYGLVAVRHWRKAGERKLRRMWIGLLVTADLVTGIVTYFIVFNLMKAWFG